MDAAPDSAASAASPPATPEQRPDDELARLLALVERAVHARGWGRPAQLVRIDPGDGALGIAIRPLPPGRHPEEALLGFRAPPGWPTLGLIAEGEGAPITAAGAATDGIPGRSRGARQSTCTRPAGRRVRIALLATRQGSVVSQLRVGDDEPSVAVHRPGELPAGRLVDLLLRALALPTVPAMPTTTALWATLWLEALATTTPAPVTWPAVAALHPAMRHATAPCPTPQALSEVAATAGAVVSWERLRRDAAAGSWHPPRLSADDAAWMDAGAFARWVLGELPGLDVVGEVACSRIPSHLATDVDGVLASWRLR